LGGISEEVPEYLRINVLEARIYGVKPEKPLKNTPGPVGWKANAV
jgi:hypothetical protein